MVELLDGAKGAPPVEKKTRGEHCLNVFVSMELKTRLQNLARRHERTMADMVRALLHVGIPVMEGITEAEELMMKEYVELFRRTRSMRELKQR